MRIIAGKYRHRLIYWPDDSSIRPTKDRVREAIFASISSHIDKAVFLDLYAGSGSMGIEALSRGAKKVYFIDHSVNAIKCVQENLKLLNVNEDYEIIKTDDASALNKFKEENIKFDIIFLDPPYLDGKYEEIITWILDNELINEHGIILAESNRQLSLNHHLIKKEKQYKYGEILVTYLGV